ncbi:unnamed protein product [Closterium sp. NIES-54]
MLLRCCFLFFPASPSSCGVLPTALPRSLQLFPHFSLPPPPRPIPPPPSPLRAFPHPRFPASSTRAPFLRLQFSSSFLCFLYPPFLSSRSLHLLPPLSPTLSIPASAPFHLTRSSRTADLPFVSEPLGPERAHAVVARANATWQLFVDQNVPAEPWAPPAAVLNGSFLESIWKRKYMGDCAPSAAIPVSQPAHLQQQQQAENAAQKAAAEAVSGALVEEKPANGKWGGKLRGIFRTKSGRLMPSRLGGGSSDKCPIPKASTSHCSNSNSSSSNSSSSSGSGGGGGGGGGGSSAGAGFGSGMGSLRSSGSSPESNLLRQQIPSSGHVWSHAESGESREAFGDRLRRATSLDPGQLEPGSGKSSGLGGAVSGHGKPPVQHRRCESFEHYGSSKPKGLPKVGVSTNSPSPCRKPPGLSPLRLTAEPNRHGILKPSSSSESLESIGSHKRNDSGSSSHSQEIIQEEEEEEEPPIHWRRSKSETVNRNKDKEDGEVTLVRSNTAGRRVKFKEEVDVVMLADEDEGEERAAGGADDIFQLKFTLALALDNEGQVFPSPRKILFTNA